MSTVQPFGFLQRGFLHLPVSVRGLRRSKLTLQVSSPGRPNKDNAMRLISPRCSSCTKRLISTTQKKWIQYIRHNIVSTFLSPSSCCQCPCWGAVALSAVMRLDSAWQQRSVEVRFRVELLLGDLQLCLFCWTRAASGYISTAEVLNEVVSSVTALFWANRRERGSWVWRKHVRTANHSCLCVLCWELLHR